MRPDDNCDVRSEARYEWNDTDHRWSLGGESEDA